MAAPPVRYRNQFMDSSRWDDIELRDGDIIISTPAKCGTTWTQIICGLLVFGRPELPAPLDELTHWPDATFRVAAEVRAALEAQRHRRFIKTHTPLDGLPRREDVTYVGIGRDPRDVAVSLDNHLANTDWRRMQAARVAAMGAEAEPLELLPPDSTPYERFWHWAYSEDELFGLRAMLAHIEGFWERRGEPGIVLLHYDELKADLEGRMRSLAAALGIAIDEEVWPRLVRAATFEEVRGRAETLAPEADLWKDRAEFFHRGTSGQWRAMLGTGDLERYRARVAELTTPEVAEWVHGGPI